MRYRYSRLISILFQCFTVGYRYRLPDFNAVLMFLYEEGMLECHDYLAWTVDTLEKIKPSDDITLRFLIPYVMQFAEEFVKSQMLSRRLAYYCGNRLCSLIEDSQTCQSTNQVASASSSNQNMYQALFSEYLGCPQHRTIILGLGTLLQCITIKCPSAVIWINSSDAKDKHIASPGSPLDILPFPPSSLPISGGPTLQNHQIRGALRHIENQIKVRSRAVELRWSSDKCQDSDTGHTISKELQTLEYLDKHNFEKCDSNNSLDSLYHKIFPGASQREGSEVPFGEEPVILLLCSWAVCPQRSGEHRAFVVTHLLERRMIELEDEKTFDLDQLESKSGTIMNQFLENQAPPVFQRILQDFLDNQAPVADENSSPEEKRAFSSLILLFSQLIQNEVFSLDAYMCLLISRGNLINSIPLGIPSDQGLDGQGRPRGKEVKDEVDDGKEDSSDRSDDYDIFDKPPPAPAPPQDMGAQENQSYSFQQKFIMETLQNQKYESNSDVYDDDQDSQESEDQEKKSEEDSRSPSPQVLKLNRHLLYSKHFPLPQGEISTHETNQRLLLLYGYGKVRKEVRSYIRGVKRDIIILLSDQKTDLSRKTDSLEKRLKVDSGQDVAIAKLKLLPYFDQHLLTTAAAKHILERVQTCTRSGWETLPSLEQIICLLDLLEDALNIHGMLEFIVKLLDHINVLDSEVLKDKAPENYTTNVCLSIVGVLRRYQACLLGSKDQTATIFELLCGVVKHVNNVTNCTSAERCILAYLYDLYMSCSFLKVKFSDMFSSVASKVKEQQTTNIQPSESNLKWNENYMQEYIANPKSRHFNLSTLGKQLSENSVNRYSFVCNALIAICNTGSMERIRDLSILCAELTASCNGLISEWLGVLRALCCSSNHGCGFTDLLCEVDKVDVSDTSTHDKIAMFTAILIARHCFSLDDVVEHVAMASLIAATPSFSGAVEMDTDAEPGARLMCHLLLRLFCSSLVGGTVSSQPDEQKWISILSSCDRHLLEAAHRGISVDPLVGVLKALLLIGDSGEDGGGGSSLFDTAEDITPEDASPLGNRSGSTIESASLRTYAKYTLKTICAQECVREICLKEPERLLTAEVLLDQLLSQKQMHYLLHLICYPNGVPSIGAKTSDNEQKQTIERILKTLDQWTLRISLLELQLMLKQSSGQSELVLLDNISKATMEVFHHQQSGNKSKPTKASRKRQEQERNSIWLVAPLISKLSGSVQGRVLRSAATILESVGQTWTAKPGSKDKQEKRSNQMSLASPQPLLSLVLTCLKGQDDQKEGLLTSLQTQLTQFLQTPKDDRWEDPKSHQLMHEALQLRLSLVGNMFDTIMRSNTWTTEFAILLLQLITSGPIDVKSTPELFTTVLDMMNVLINSTLSSDPGASPGAGDESKQHQQLIKKLKKELGDKRSEGIDRMRQLLPVPRRTVEVLTCEPMGSLIDTKGNKITGFDSIIKKQGLQVASKQKVTPWDMLELPKNQGPLSWSWFGGVRMERKPLQYHEQYRLSLFHSHYNQLPDDHFFNPPPLPPDEEEVPLPPPEPEKEIQEADTPKPSGDISSSKGLGSDADKAKPKRKPRKRKVAATPRDQHLGFPPGMQPPFAENPHHQSQMFHSIQVPYQQPLPPAGPLRPDRQTTTGGRQALKDMLAKQNNPPIPMQHQYPIISKRNEARKQFEHHQHGNISLSTNRAMFQNQYKNPHPDASMHHINPNQTPQGFNRNFPSQLMTPSQMTTTHHQPGGATMNYSQYQNQAQVNPAQAMMPGMRQPHPHRGRNFMSQPMSTPAILHQHIRQRSMRSLADQGMQHQGAAAATRQQQAYNLQHQLPQQQHPDQQQRLMQLQQQQQQLMKIQQPNMNLMQQLQAPGRPHSTMTPPRAGPGNYQY
ncbi:mediator of RNA polymerase II transcription subunit 12-like protein isoform X3 [Apostichopus japonicus]|uniref:mediator of RNA polymerase II transcription subunit 12-like protein isoform X3 n=1 Tax=Stichopus japonicus TaxID=307972 RepID=UPI003AB53F9E